MASITKLNGQATMKPITIKNTVSSVHAGRIVRVLVISSPLSPMVNIIWEGKAALFKLIRRALRSHLFKAAG